MVIQVEVAYALADKQMVIPLTVEAGCTLGEAIQQSGILDFFPEIDLTQQKIGVFSQIKKLTDLVSAGDRIEIYRRLQLDPKELRKKKVRD